MFSFQILLLILGLIFFSLTFFTQNAGIYYYNDLNDTIFETGVYAGCVSMQNLFNETKCFSKYRLFNLSNFVSFIFNFRLYNT